jgi:hypothetical protein
VHGSSSSSPLLPFLLLPLLFLTCIFLYFLACYPVSANEFCQQGNRSTISANDVLCAMEELEFDSFKGSLVKCLEGGTVLNALLFCLLDLHSSCSYFFFFFFFFSQCHSCPSSPPSNHFSQQPQLTRRRKSQHKRRTKAKTIKAKKRTSRNRKYKH